MEELQLKDNKYYTPSIEEFHVGFEYEMKPWKKGGKDSDRLEWIKENNLTNWNLIYTDDVNPIFELEELIENDWIRVKYLNKEDIESLGFIPNKEVKYYYKKDNYQISYREENHYIQVWKNEETYSTSSKRKVPWNHVIFDGYIKNISELKILLKQLGVN